MDVEQQSEVKPGDVVWYLTEDERNPHHAKLYVVTNLHPKREDALYCVPIVSPAILLGIDALRKIDASGSETF